MMSGEINESVADDIRIPVNRFIEKYRVSNQSTIETLKEFPVLSYLLGNASDGSGLYGLTNSEDAIRWKGIFNHIVGSARNVYFLADRVQHATKSQKLKLASLGYDMSSLNSIDANVLRDIKLIDHAGRRRSDEAHPSANPEKTTIALLQKSGASSFITDTVNQEAHTYIIPHSEHGRLKNIQLAILSYGDWTYEQNPVGIEERFRGLRDRSRENNDVLDKLEQIGKTFESDMKSVFGDTIIHEMMASQPYSWETAMRMSYAASAGLTPESLFTNKNLIQ